jgi:hypothetical protein
MFLPVTLEKVHGVAVVCCMDDVHAFVISCVVKFLLLPPFWLNFVCIYIFTTVEMSTESSIMAPQKESKAIVESSRQGSDTVSDTSPQSIDTVKTWSYVSDII